MLTRVCMFCRTVMGYKEGGEGETTGLCDSKTCLYLFTGDTMYGEDKCKPSSSSSTRSGESSSVRTAMESSSPPSL